MRSIRILLLHIQQVFESRSRVIVWFLMAVFNPVVMLLFWKGSKTNVQGWSLSYITSYYLLLIIVGSILMAHIENEVGYTDIQNGSLSSYLLKPFSYYKKKFLSELSYRTLQGALAIIVTLLLFYSFGKLFAISHSPLVILGSVVIAILAIFIAFTYKMVLGLSAFWLTDMSGMFQMSEMFIFIFSGYIVPLYLYPKVLDSIAYVLPFSYIIYFPIASLQGKLSFQEELLVIGVQGFWLLALALLYKYMWTVGVKKFTGVGQ